jgi:hypothetical protein
MDWVKARNDYFLFGKFKNLGGKLVKTKSPVEAVSMKPPKRTGDNDTAKNESRISATAAEPKVKVRPARFGLERKFCPLITEFFCLSSKYCPGLRRNRRNDCRVLASTAPHGFLAF